MIQMKNEDSWGKCTKENKRNNIVHQNITRKDLMGGGGILWFLYLQIIFIINMDHFGKEKKCFVYIYILYDF